MKVLSFFFRRKKYGVNLNLPLQHEGCSLPWLEEMGESFIMSMKIFIAINEKSRYWEEKLSMKIDDDGLNLCTRQLIPVFDQSLYVPMQDCKKAMKSTWMSMEVSN